MNNKLSSFKEAIGDKSWDKLIIRIKEVNTDIISKGIHPCPGGKEDLLTGYSYGEFYDWDLYFENLYLSYFGINDYCFSNLKEFLNRQLEDGFVSRTLLDPRPTQHFKPFLAQIAVLGSEQIIDYTWLEGKYYERLKKYIDKWFAYDFDKNGLPVWDSADHSGMDNQNSRAGRMHSFTREGVDLACYLVRELDSMAVIAQKLNKQDESKAFMTHAKNLKTTINEVFWDENDGFYYDRNEKTKKLVKVKSVVSFLPLWVGVPSATQAKRLVEEHLLNEKEFWIKYPIPCYSITEPDYYQGSKKGECNWRGSSWIPTNYMIFHGLMRYGYTEIAKELADYTFDMALNQNETTREYYNAETGGGNGLNPFWGWSALAYIMPLEYQLNYNPTDLPNSKIQPIVKEYLGIDWE